MISLLCGMKVGKEEIVKGEGGEIVLQKTYYMLRPSV